MPSASGIRRSLLRASRVLPDPPGSLVWDGGFESNVVGGGFTWRYPSFIGGVRDHSRYKGKTFGESLPPADLQRPQQCEFQRCLSIHPRPAFHHLSVFRVGTDACYCPPIKACALDCTPSVTRSIPSPGRMTFGALSRGRKSNFPGRPGNDVRELQLCVSRLPSAKFDSKIRGSAWIDDVALVPLSAENTGQ